MRHFFMRIQSFVRRLQWLGRYMPGYPAAAVYMIKTKFSKDHAGTASYKGRSFSFYPRDMSAIREVLADNEYVFLSPYLKKIPSPVILDTGAHIGLFSLWALGENPSARILSLEASPETYQTLSRNVAEANKGGSQWAALHGAAWKNDELISFATSGDSMGHKVSSAPGGQFIKGVSLAALMEEVSARYGASRVDLLKIDIEGAEEAFITPYESLLQNVGQIAIELHPKSCDTDKVRVILSKYYTHIVPCTDRLSQKPLLHCYNTVNA